MNFLIRLGITFVVGFFVWWACPLVAIALFNSSLQHAGPVSSDQVEFWRVTLFHLSPFAAMLFTWDAWKGTGQVQDQKKRFDLVRFSIYVVAFIVFIVGALQTLKLPPFPGLSIQPHASKPQAIKL